MEYKDRIKGGIVSKPLGTAATFAWLQLYCKTCISRSESVYKNLYTAVTSIAKRKSTLLSQNLHTLPFSEQVMHAYINCTVWRNEDAIFFLHTPAFKHKYAV